MGNTALVTVTAAPLTSTKVSASLIVTNAVTSATEPVIATALDTVTVPAVLPPRVLKSDAVTASVSPSLTVIVIASVEAVVKAPRLANELAARVAVTTPEVLAAMAFNSAIDGVPVTVTAASSNTTKVSAVTNAAVTSATLPVIATALVTVTCPVVFPPIALNSVAVIAVVSTSLTVTVASLTTTLVPSVTNLLLTDHGHL